MLPVPLIARWPAAIKAGGRCDHLVQLQDLAHTYAQAGGAKAMPYPDGRSLMPLFEDPKRTDWSDDILCAYYGGEFLYTQRIAINQRYKYVFNGFDFDELYDLERDPAEMRNVVDAPEYREAVGRHAAAAVGDDEQVRGSIWGRAGAELDRPEAGPLWRRALSAASVRSRTLRTACRLPGMARQE